MNKTRQDKTRQDKTRQDNCQECKTNVKRVTCILKDLGTTFERQTDVAVTLRARDWKGLDNYGSNCVIEIYEKKNG